MMTFKVSAVEVIVAVVSRTPVEDGGQTGHPGHVLPLMTNVVGTRAAGGQGTTSIASTQSTTGQRCCTMSS